MIDQAALTRALYEGALEPAVWATSMRQLAASLGAHGFHLLAWDRGLQTQTFGVTTEDLGDDPLGEYGAYYGGIDRCRAVLATTTPGYVFASQARFTRAYIDRDEYHQDFLRRYDIRHRLGACLWREDGLDYYLALLRAPRRGEFPGLCVEDCTRWMPHLAGAMRVFHRTRYWREAAGAGQQALDALDFGVFVLSPARRIILANQTAEALLEDSAVLTTRTRRLQAATHCGEVQLVDACARVSRTGHPAFLRLCGNPSAARTPLNLSIMKLPVDSYTGAPISDARLLVLVHEGQQRAALSGAALVAWFALTPAETRLALALAQGVTVEGHAAQTGIKTSTVRTHLRGVLTKTGCRRQQDLVCLLVGAPRAGRRPG